MGLGGTATSVIAQVLNMCAIDGRGNMLIVHKLDGRHRNIADAVSSEFQPCPALVTRHTTTLHSSLASSHITRPLQHQPLVPVRTTSPSTHQASTTDLHRTPHPPSSTLLHKPVNRPNYNPSRLQITLQRPPAPTNTRSTTRSTQTYPSLIHTITPSVRSFVRSTARMPPSTTNTSAATYTSGSAASSIIKSKVPVVKGCWCGDDCQCCVLPCSVM